MNVWQSVFLGFLQGVTEFLPVSSSGHLFIMKGFLNLEDIPILFDVILHLATLIVVVIIFRQRIGGILASLGRLVVGKRREADSDNIRILWVVAIATVCTGVLGLLISDISISSVPWLVPVLFIVTGGILITTRWMKGELDYSRIGLKTALITGIAQGLGVFPGISRSGITISGSMFSGMSRDKAGEYAFILSIPAILGATVLLLKDAGELFSMVEPGILAAGFITSFVIGFISLLLLLRIIRKGRLYLFAFYLIPLGIITLFLNV
jgi:undecaprenyl-diphosphatase